MEEEVVIQETDQEEVKNMHEEDGNSRKISDLVGYWLFRKDIMGLLRTRDTTTTSSSISTTDYTTQLSDIHSYNILGL